MPLKILLVHNNKMRWADTFRAEELKKYWTDDEVDIVNRWNLPDGDKYDIIHFLYSGGITKSKKYILKHKDKVFTSLASQRTLDYTFDKKEDLIEIYQKTRVCVCQNKKLYKALKNLIRQNNIVYIPNGVDTQLFSNPFKAGFVGAKDSWEHKGYYLAQQACDELGIELLTAKEWDYTHETMPDFYKKIDCLIIPSLSEGCNNPTLEALAMNLPVISTDTGIADELEGVMVVERTVASIKKVLSKLTTRRTNIEENYSWKIIAKKYHQIYELEKQGA